MNRLQRVWYALTHPIFLAALGLLAIVILMGILASQREFVYTLPELDFDPAFAPAAVVVVGIVLICLTLAVSPRLRNGLWKSVRKPAVYWSLAYVATLLLLFYVTFMAATKTMVPSWEAAFDPT